MDELISRLTGRLGIDSQTAQKLVVIIIQFLGREAPPSAMAPLVAAHPWLAEILAATPPLEAPPASERHFGGMARLMEVADRMMAFGLTMGQVQEAVRETVGYARESVGAEPIDALVRTVPGLRQVV